MSNPEVEEEVKLRKQLLSAILNLIVRLVGETVKDKLARSVIIGLVCAGGYYYDLPATDVKVETPKPAVVINK